MSVKPLTVKQAEKWLDKLKNENPQSYKDLAKYLRKYEKSQDDYDCYIKISHTLLGHADLTKELNIYMDQGNKFVIPKPDQEKIKELMSFVKRNRPEIFDKIINLITDLSKSKGENGQEMGKLIKPRIKEIVEGDLQLERITEEALQFLGAGEELITRKNLEHLKVTRQNPTIIQEQKQVSRPPPKPQSERQVTRNEVKPPPEVNRRQPRILIGNFSNSSEERAVFRQFQKMVDEETYQYIIKVIKIYFFNIITRNEAFDLLANVQADELYMECIRDIIDARQTDRRKHSEFKPLNDMNFSNALRASPSYVQIPPYYAVRSSGKSIEVRALTNDKWVSVPYGSEQSQNFSVRNKNSNEINLLKAEDERYQFDIYMKRLEKTLQLLQQLLDQKNIPDQQKKSQLVAKIVNMGVLQLIFKNCNKDQKQQIECFLKVNQSQTCKFFKDKIQMQIIELKGIKDIHANKCWSEVAAKNFFKALDLKGFQFKKNQKDRMRGNFFISELQERSKVLQNGGENKNTISFQDKKEFFIVLNSFESSSRTERCNTRTLPQIQTFDLKDQKRRHFYPLITLAFQDQQACQHLYTLLIFYLDNSQISETQKIRSKYFLEQFLVDFLGWNTPIKRYLNDNFDEEKLYAKISKTNEEEIDYKNWTITEPEISVMNSTQKSEQEKIKMGYLNDQTSQYSYLPPNLIINKYIWIRTSLYFNKIHICLYERLIKMKEIAEDQEKLDLFELLFYVCIKAKEGIKFQENLNLLFGKHAYLISTLYKLFDNLIKSLGQASNCLLINYSFKFVKQQSEDLYFVLINRFCLANNLTCNKLLRLTYNKDSKVIYFNYLDSYYKSDDIGKDVSKKRQENSKGIQIYTVDNFGFDDSKKRRKLNEMLINNEMQYTFEGTTIKMLNHLQNEDSLFLNTKKTNLQKTINRNQNVHIRQLQKLIDTTINIFKQILQCYF